MKKVAILGSTGSIGKNAVEICQHNKFQVSYLACNKNVAELYRQIEIFNPKLVSVDDKDSYLKLREKLKNSDFKTELLLQGKDEIAEHGNYDILLNSVVGAEGVKSSYHALNRGKRLALANKESLVVFGDRLMEIAAEKNAELIPVDSEHSAIFQSLGFYKNRDINKIILTASGGPFRTKTKDFITLAKASQALQHPNWSMGQKISIDSATLMNKGLEVIEAMHIFDVSVKQIDIVVHQESILHSAVSFVDGSIIGQFGMPSMKLPIQYALTYPKRMELSGENFDFTKIAKLNFEKPDMLRFPCLKLALQSAEVGGVKPIVLNAANEVLVKAYLEDRIGFYDISNILEKALEREFNYDHMNLQEVIECDKEVRKFTLDYIQKFS